MLRVGRRHQGGVPVRIAFCLLCCGVTHAFTHRSLALRFHPDKATDPRSQAACAAVFKVAAEANAVLTDVGKRVAYDALVTKQKLRGGVR